MNNRVTYFVDVILPLSVPNLYSYRVPYKFNEYVKVGQRVVIQFGRKKLYTAIIAKIHQQVPDYQTKYIESILDDSPVVTQEQLKFWTWISEFYMCNIGSVMKAALPSGLKLASETKILRHTALVNYDNISDDECLILDALEINSVLSLEEISNILSKKVIYHIVKSMIDKKLVIAEEELKNLYKPKQIAFIDLSEEYKSEDRLQEAFALIKKAPKQEDMLLKFLNASNYFSAYKPVAKKELLNLSNSSNGVLSALVTKNILEINYKTSSRFDDYTNKNVAKLELTRVQNEAYLKIRSSFKNKKVALLHGVTGSGKTEIFIKLIKEQLKQNKKVLYLLPEIAITSQIINRLRKYFGKKVGVYHSKFSSNERLEIWNSLIDDKLHEYDIVIGARSAIFLPLKNIGLIVVDEEHEYSFKQFDPAPRYNAKEASYMLAKIHKSALVLASATPSIESMYNASNQIFNYIDLNVRYKGVEMPEIQIVNLKEITRKKKMKGVFSPVLLDAMNSALERKEQIILFQNRRGYSPSWTCKLCGWKPGCKSCDVSLTYHKMDCSMHCHYCGYKILPPIKCSACGSSDLIMQGYGTEKIEEEIKIHLGDKYIVQRMDRDTTRSKYAYQKIITAFENKEIDILVGTQMVSKGLDFDNVSLVGILNADNLLYFPDFRAFERSYQLLTQVSGRAGRKNIKGKVIIQSFTPDHWVIKKVIDNDYLGMYNQELLERKEFKYPPFYRLIKLVIVHRDKDIVDLASDIFVKMLAPKMLDKILGPEYPSVPRIRNLYSKVITLKIQRELALKEVREFLQTQIIVLNNDKRFKSVRIKIDVNPIG